MITKKKSAHAALNYPVQIAAHLHSAWLAERVEYVGLAEPAGASGTPSRARLGAVRMASPLRFAETLTRSWWMPRSYSSS